MSQAPVSYPLTLPPPPDRYDRQDQIEIRRAIQRFMQDSVASAASAPPPPAGVPNVTASCDVAGNVTLSVDGGSGGIASYMYLGSTVSAPLDATTVASGALISVPSTVIVAALVLTQGQTGYFTVVPFSGAGASGTQLPSVHAVVSFPLNLTQGVPQGTGSVDPGGNVELNVDGPAWVASWRWLSSTSAFPTDFSTTSTGALLTGRQQNVPNAGPGGFPINMGDTCYATFVPFTGAGATGQQGPSLRIRCSFQNWATSKRLTLPGATLRPVDTTAPKYIWNYLEGSVSCPSGVPFLSQQALADVIPLHGISGSFGVTITGFEIYGTLIFNSGHIPGYAEMIEVDLVAINRTTQAVTVLASPQIFTNNGAIQLVGSYGIGHTVDNTTYAYGVRSHIYNEDPGATTCKLWNYSLLYTPINFATGT